MSYTELRNARNIRIEPELGQVDIEITRNGDSKRLLVTPLQACILMLFQDHESIDLPTAYEITKCPVDIIKNVVRFWADHGVLKLSGDKIIQVTQTLAKDEVADEEMMNCENLNISHRLKENVDTCKPLIEGMLTNSGPAAIDRIHSLLGMFFPGVYSLGVEQLENVLSHLVSTELLDREGDVYKVK